MPGAAVRLLCNPDRTAPVVAAGDRARTLHYLNNDMPLEAQQVTVSE